MTGAVPSSVGVIWLVAVLRNPDPVTYPSEVPSQETTAAGRADLNSQPARLTAWVRGHVQGVGFRWWTRSQALALGLVGTAANLDDGRVEVVAEGERWRCEVLLAWLGEQPSDHQRPGRVTGVAHRWSEPRGASSGFRER